MKLIVFSGILKPTKDMQLSDIKGTSELYSYYLRREFEKMGIETEPGYFSSGGATPAKLLKIVIPKGDHALSVAQRGFDVRGNNYPPFIEHVRKNIKGKLTSICDHLVKYPIEDMIFHATPWEEHFAKNKYVSWACDHDILYPEKDPVTFRILIDHAYYKDGNNKDISESIAEQCVKFQQTHKDKPVIIRRFGGPEGIENVDKTNTKYKVYDRSTSLPFPLACEEYRKADIFIVTHPESMGLSVLESGAAGALVVTPEGYIKTSLLKPIYHLSFIKEIDWTRVLDMINVKKSVEYASPYRWDKIAKLMAEEFR